MNFNNQKYNENIELLKNKFFELTNKKLILIDETNIELNQSIKFTVINDIIEKILVFFNTRKDEKLNIKMFFVQQYCDSKYNQPTGLKLKYSFYYRNEYFLKISDVKNEINIFEFDKKYYNRVGEISKISRLSILNDKIKTRHIIFEDINSSYFYDINGFAYTHDFEKVPEYDLIDEFTENEEIKNIEIDLISISSNIKQKFVRRDGKIAGPFDKNESTNPITYFDKENHELYDDDGKIYGKTGILDEELITKYISQKNKKSNKNINYPYPNIDNFDYSQIPEENLCQCEDCKFSRSLLRDNIKSDLIQKIELVYDKLLKYDKNAPKLPNFYYVSTSLQTKTLYEFLKILYKFGGLKEIEEIPDFKEIIEEVKNDINKKQNLIQKVVDKNKSLENKKLILLKIMNLHKLFLSDKNMLINLSTKKLVKNDLNKLKSILKVMEILYNQSVKFPKIRKVELQNVTKNLTQKEINENSILQNSVENEEGLLNPLYNYIYVIKNGTIEGIYPISRKK